MGNERVNSLVLTKILPNEVKAFHVGSLRPFPGGPTPYFFFPSFPQKKGNFASHMISWYLLAHPFRLFLAPYIDLTFFLTIFSWSFLFLFLSNFLSFSIPCLPPPAPHYISRYPPPPLGGGVFSDKCTHEVSAERLNVLGRDACTLILI